MLNIYTVPLVFKTLFSKLVWNIPTEEKIIYLTFDDGPIPTITQYVLDVLDAYQAKATFFCVGENVAKYPNILLKIMENNHAIGNHTYNHLNGWKTDKKMYLDNIEACDEIITSINPTYHNNMFRPPYGRINVFSTKVLLKVYKIIMWDVLSGDYDCTVDPEKCLQRCIQYTKPGTIIVFHDSLKAEKNLKYILPKYLEYFKEKNYKFECIEF